MEADNLNADADLLASGADVAVGATCPQRVIAIFVCGTALWHVVFVALGHKAPSLRRATLTVPTDFFGITVSIDGAGPLIGDAGMHAR